MVRRNSLKFIGNDQPAVVYRIAWWQRFFNGSMGSGEVGELIWRGDLGFSTGAVGFS